MTYVDSVSRRKVTMTDRRRDKQNFPLSASALPRNACVKSWFPKEEERRPFLFLGNLSLVKHFFLLEERNAY